MSGKTISVALNPWEYEDLLQIKKYWENIYNEEFTISDIVRWCMKIEVNRENGIMLEVKEVKE